MKELIIGALVMLVVLLLVRLARRDLQNEAADRNRADAVARYGERRAGTDDPTDDELLDRADRYLSGREDVRGGRQD